MKSNTKSEYGRTAIKVPIDYNIWFALEADAKRCKRRPAQQIEALLEAYFDENYGYETLPQDTEALPKPSNVIQFPLERIAGGVQ